MSSMIRFIPAMAVLVASQTFAADTGKIKVLDKLDRIDPKTLTFFEAKAKVVATPDPDHRKALEMVIDYAKAGAWSGLRKSFPEGTINPKKYSAIRFWVRGNSETRFNVDLGGSYTRKDGKLNHFHGGNFKATDAWTQITVPLDKFTRHGDKIWKNGAQVIIPGGDAPDDEDFSGFNRVGFGTIIDMRGTSSVGHLMFDGIELIEK